MPTGISYKNILCLLHVNNLLYMKGVLIMAGTIYYGYETSVRSQVYPNSDDTLRKVCDCTVIFDDQIKVNLVKFIPEASGNISFRMNISLREASIADPNPHVSLKYKMADDKTNVDINTVIHNCDKIKNTYLTKMTKILSMTNGVIFHCQMLIVRVDSADGGDGFIVRIFIFSELENTNEMDEENK